MGIYFLLDIQNNAARNLPPRITTLERDTQDTNGAKKYIRKSHQSTERLIEPSGASFCRFLPNCSCHWYTARAPPPEI